MRLIYGLLLWVVTAHTLAASEIKAVPRIVDGDTIYADTVKIRLSGIDAPETDQLCLDSRGQSWACGIEAKTRLQDFSRDRVWVCDRGGIAARVLTNLVDVLPVTQKAVALPLPNYSLKVVEEFVGFKRTQEEYGGQWAMAQYIEATEMEDEAERQKVMTDILKYNEEDLAATWAVFFWLRTYGNAITATH